MLKRTVLLGTYDTAAHGWTLTGQKLSDPQMKTNYVNKTGGDGTWDWSTVMTDGLPRYGDRTLNLTFECSEGTRADRETLISEIVNTLDGLEWEITLPDHTDYYLVGRLHVAVNYSDFAHAAVTITGNCRPWLYKKTEKVIILTAASTSKSATLVNSGRLAVVPTLEVEDGTVSLTYGTATTSMSAGTYTWPTLLLTPGNHPIQYKGSGKLTISYREAVLR